MAADLLGRPETVPSTDGEGCLWARPQHHPAMPVQGRYEYLHTAASLLAGPQQCSNFKGMLPVPPLRGFATPPCPVLLLLLSADNIWSATTCTGTSKLERPSHNSLVRAAQTNHTAAQNPENTARAGT